MISHERLLKRSSRKSCSPRRTSTPARRQSSRPTRTAKPTRSCGRHANGGGTEWAFRSSGPPAPRRVDAARGEGLRTLLPRARPRAPGGPLHSRLTGRGAGRRSWPATVSASGARRDAAASAARTDLTRSSDRWRSTTWATRTTTRSTGSRRSASSTTQSGRRSNGPKGSGASLGGEHRRSTRGCADTTAPRR